MCVSHYGRPAGGKLMACAGTGCCFVRLRRRKDGQAIDARAYQAVRTPFPRLPRSYPG